MIRSALQASARRIGANARYARHQAIPLSVPVSRWHVSTPQFSKRAFGHSASAQQTKQHQEPLEIPNPHDAAVTVQSTTPVSPSDPSLGPITCNITPAIEARIGRNLHRQLHHPIHTIKHQIETYFQRQYQQNKDNSLLYTIIDNESPKVTIQSNFDDLLIPQTHPSRRMTDTFYYDERYCLRCHTSAHQTKYLREGLDAFLITGDCYRRDEIDARHYPVFHQMEGVRLFSADKMTSAQVFADLKATLTGLVYHIFGPNIRVRWVEAFFPFTDPSAELEVEYDGRWLEVLGCGNIQTQILHDTNRHNMCGWAFGIGLERLAMVLFNIPDIRLFWSTDKRFLDQFIHNTFTQFIPFSKYPPCLKDIAMWINDPDTFHENDLFAIIRDIGGDWIENVSLIDKFISKKENNKMSLCYRITYRSLERTLLNSEIDTVQNQIRNILPNKINVTLR